MLPFGGQAMVQPHVCVWGDNGAVKQACCAALMRVPRHAVVAGGSVQLAEVAADPAQGEAEEQGRRAGRRRGWGGVAAGGELGRDSSTAPSWQEHAISGHESLYCYRRC
jgi:hypothetical protein